MGAGWERRGAKGERKGLEGIEGLGGRGAGEELMQMGGRKGPEG